jgi:hypothetical protein
MVTAGCPAAMRKRRQGSEQAEMRKHSACFIYEGAGVSFFLCNISFHGIMEILPSVLQ